MHTVPNRRVLLLLLGSLLAGGAWAAEPVKLAIGEWPPYFSQNLRENGVFAHIVKEAFAREGLSVSYEFYPWKRALLLAENGSVSGSPGWVMSDERAKTFLFSDPVILSKEVLFFRKDKPVNFRTLADLKGKTIGATIGYSYGTAFDAAEKAGDFTLERAIDDTTNLRKLLAGRFDMIVLNRAVGFELLQSFPAADRERIAASTISVSEKQSRMVIARTLPNAEKLMQTFNQGLAKVTRDGTAKRFLDDAEAGRYTPGN